MSVTVTWYEINHPGYFKEIENFESNRTANILDQAGHALFNTLYQSIMGAAASSAFGNPAVGAVVGGISGFITDLVNPPYGFQIGDELSTYFYVTNDHLYLDVQVVRDNGLYESTQRLK